MATDPQYWVKAFAQNAAAMRQQGESSADNMLMQLFQEEAARQRPYVTMPARLAEAQYERLNAEPFAERAAQRRYRYSKAGQATAVDEGGDGDVQTDANGNEVIIIGGKAYPLS